ncbi:LLM class flavin-dependent oxidoreductase [Streptomyces sp. LARHCF252]
MFGANVEPKALPVGRSSEQALLIDSLGFDLLTVQDHPYQAAFDDTWTLLTFLAARTRHVTLVPTVSSLSSGRAALLAQRHRLYPSGSFLPPEQRLASHRPQGRHGELPPSTPPSTTPTTQRCPHPLRRRAHRRPRHLHRPGTDQARRWLGRP